MRRKIKHLTSWSQIQTFHQSLSLTISSPVQHMIPNSSAVEEKVGKFTHQNFQLNNIFKFDTRNCDANSEKCFHYHKHFNIVLLFSLQLSPIFYRNFQLQIYWTSFIVWTQKSYLCRFELESCLNCSLDWWFVALGTFDRDSLGGSCCCWLSRFASISVQFQQFRQVESWFLEDFHLKQASSWHFQHWIHLHQTNPLILTLRM